MKENNSNITEYKNLCPLVYTFNIIGQKWKIPILWHLAIDGTLRYNEIKREVHGITNIMLTKSLQELQEHHLVERKVYDCIPPKVEYSLTEHGKSLIPLLNGFDKWGRTQLEIEENNN